MPPSPFYRQLRLGYDQFLLEQSNRFPSAETVRIDLHCHDHNSDRPDELYGRILNLPETWLKTKTLIKRLANQRCDLFTITNHNNARSCWKLLDKGIDVLPGAEFTCHFPDRQTSIHVLTYGFTPEQESHLNRLRHNIYHFAAYANEHYLPTVLPHPLYFYSLKHQPTLELLELFACLFERFEVLNGQRGYWQNGLTRHWIESLTEETIDAYGKKHGLNPFDFCRRPYQKRLTGGSDDHNGIFAGSCGTLVRIPDLERRLRQQKLSTLVLEGLREGELAPFGSVGEDEKLSVTFLDYFAQVTMTMDDPGLMRLLLFNAPTEDKLWCLAIGNAIFELRRHKYTMQFLRAFHHALHGKKPGKWLKWSVSRDYKPVLLQLEQLAKAERQQPEQFQLQLRQTLFQVHNDILQLMLHRIDKGAATPIDFSHLLSLSTEELGESLELPAHLRQLFTPTKSKRGSAGESQQPMANFNPAELVDQLSFPTLALSLLLGAFFTSSRVVHANRPFLNSLAEHLQQLQHPQRILWLTDTFDDKNGVSNSMQSLLKAIQHQNYPIDILVCHPTLQPQAHLLVVRPLTSVTASQLSEQQLHLPNLLEIQKLFEQQNYDRLLCSTELFMGPVALYLQRAFSVPAWFYMHTDWLDYLKYSTRLTHELRDRFRRILRLFYRQFDGIFVLNSDHKAWLASQDMGLKESQLHLTAHWLHPNFRQQVAATPLPTPYRHDPQSDHTPILIFVGRLSEEKGVLKIPSMMKHICRELPQAQIWFAGTGPAEAALQQLLPEPQARFFGWVDKSRLIELLLSADMMVMPSKFDTFGNVILEAFHCHLPVAAFNLKGPKEIIGQSGGGILADSSKELAQQIVAVLQDHDQLQQMRQAAYRRSLDYSEAPIMQQMLTAMGVSPPFSKSNLVEISST